MAIMLAALVLYSKQNELFIKLLILNWPLINNRWQLGLFHCIRIAVKDLIYISDKSVFTLVTTFHFSLFELDLILLAQLFLFII